MKLQPFSDLLIILKATLATLAVSCSTVEVTPAPFSLLACISGAGEPSSGEAGPFSGAATTAPGNLYLLIYDAQSGLLETFTCRSGIPKQVEFGSSNGPKLAVALANVPENFLNSNIINSYESICSACRSFVDEDPDALTLSAQTSFNAHSGAVLRLNLTPLVSRITVRSLKVDFSGRSYSDAKLKDIRAYIINANGRCPVLSDGAVRATEILCQGGFNPSDTSRMKHPEMLVSECVPGCRLFCYPCAIVPELCTSRLVIEASIEGQTYYYPIDICSPTGVPRGESLIYDITITRKGSLNPDIPLEAGTVSVSWNISDWKEYEEENIVY